MGWPDAGDLLAGPRGRRLCWSLLDPGGYPGWIGVWASADAGDLTAYWQEPDGVDRALTDPGVRDVLRPVARAVTAAPGAQWWPSPVAADRQQYAEWIDEHDFSPRLAGTAAELAAVTWTKTDEGQPGWIPA
jgi:hypothetical protein